MKYKKRIILCSLAIILIFFSVILIYALHYGDKKMVSLKDLAGSEMYIRNTFCTEAFQNISVDDKAFYNKIAALCVKATPYRPVAKTAVILGISPDVAAIFENESVRYSFSVGTVETIEKQLSLEYIHRDKPVISVSKEPLSGDDYVNSWAWDCLLKPDEYAELVELLQTYSGKIAGK